MKKVKWFGLAAAALVLGACGSDTEGNTSSASSSSSSTAEVASSVASESEAVESSAENTPAVSDTTYEGSNGTYVIKEVEQMTGKYGDAQIVAITMDYTNTTEEPQNPWFAIAFDMSATQETETTIETLNGANGQYPDDYKPEAVANSDVDIKPGATVEVVVGYEIITPGTPVFLKNFDMMGTDGSAFYREIPTTQP